jgi:Gram-negative bacterial TonB protein C-terminal
VARPSFEIGLPKMKQGLPELAVPPQKRYAWWSSIRAITQPVGAATLLSSAPFFKNVPVITGRVPFKGISSSGVIHVIFIFLILRIGALLPAPELDIQPIAPQAIIYYYVPRVPPVEHFPNIQPAGPGGKPGEGVKTTAPPKAGATAPHPKLTVVMKFLHPDSRRQTILQPKAPDLKINQDLKLPNLITGNPFVAKMPQNNLNQTAPRLAAKNVNTQEPDLAAQNSPINMANVPVTVQDPHLTVPVGTRSSVPIQRRGAAGGLGSGDALADAPGVIVIGIDPSDAAEANLPGGNRYGAFTLAAPGGQPGSPGGAANGDLAGGSAGAGTSPGDASSGVGKGERGGGGGGGPVDAAMSVSGGNGKGGALLNGFNPEALVFRVPVLPVRRDHTLVITAGPIGGGGLANYGVLHGQLIQTVYLDMTGGSWILEFCELQSSPDPAGDSSGARVQIQLPRAIVPPAPTEKFDFKRPPVPSDTRHPMVVLHGTIQEDGTVGNLSALDGPSTESEEVAQAAFNKWKFEPALKAGHPVAVEILVGMPGMSAATASK